MFDKYKVKLTLTRQMLGTNPFDPAVMDRHLIERQRKIILEKSKINTEINKYLNQIQISDERKEEELTALLDKIEEMTGLELPKEDRAKILRGELESLKETFAEFLTKGTTVFLWNKEKDLPCIGDHMILGFLKAASEAIGRTLKTKAGTVLQSISYTQSLINQHVRCEERLIAFDRDIKRTETGLPEYCQRSLRAMTAQGPRISLAKSEVMGEGANLTFTLKVLKDSPITKEVLERLFSYGELSGLGQWRNAGNGQFTYSISKVK